MIHLSRGLESFSVGVEEGTYPSMFAYVTKKEYAFQRGIKRLLRTSFTISSLNFMSSAFTRFELTRAKRRASAPYFATTSIGSV